jgi:hypothetical protein
MPDRGFMMDSLKNKAIPKWISIESGKLWCRPGKKEVEGPTSFLVVKNINRGGSC